MPHPLTGPVLFTLAGALAFGQAGDTRRLEFEVASIKPAAQPGGPGRPTFIGFRGGPGTDDPGQITYTGLPLRFLITNAYDVKPYQVIGPAWLDTERFDVTAKVPSGTTKEQARVMIQNLLADRFGLKLHHDTKDSQVYELVVDKGGPKLKLSDVQDDPPPAKPDPAAPPPPPGPPKLGKDGFPQLDRPGLFTMMNISPSGPRARLMAKAQTMAQLATPLGNQVNRPVVDKTGLTGKYDFTLEFSFEPGGGGPMGLPMPPLPPGGFGGAGGGEGGGAGGRATAAGPGGGPSPAPAEAQSTDSAPTVFAALREQLGLRLEQKKAPLDMLVIDHVEKTPTEN